MSIGDDWLRDAFFERAPKGSIDGGTTNLGPLWHAVSPRWGHSMHTMCSYHGMFPAKLVHYFVQRYTLPADTVLDPFSGRGTTTLQAGVEGRRTISNDLNPLAYVLSRAKADPPTWTAMARLLSSLRQAYSRRAVDEPDVPAEIRMLFHQRTLKQLVFVRDRLLSKPLLQWTSAEAMLGGAIAGILHGSFRRDGTSQYLSISMPNTFSMSPGYVRRFIADHELAPPDQDLFDRALDKIARLYLDEVRPWHGVAFSMDATRLLAGGSIKPRSVKLALTSPPYLRVVNYGTANWIRLWWLGLDGVGTNAGAGRRSLDAVLDHKHSYESYCTFMRGVMRGLRRVLCRDGVAVVVVGDVAKPGQPSLSLAHQLWSDIGATTGLRLVDVVEDFLPAHNKVSRIWGDTRGRATDRDCIMILCRTDGDAAVTCQEVLWDEPYKDGGPDAAHAHAQSRGQSS
jgi:hypothetical protein